MLSIRKTTQDPSHPHITWSRNRKAEFDYLFVIAAKVKRKACMSNQSALLFEITGALYENLVVAYTAHDEVHYRYMRTDSASNILIS
jgi:hypothetical protein